MKVQKLTDAHLDRRRHRAFSSWRPAPPLPQAYHLPPLTGPPTIHTGVVVPVYTTVLPEASSAVTRLYRQMSFSSFYILRFCESNMADQWSSFSTVSP